MKSPVATEPTVTHAAVDMIPIIGPDWDYWLVAERHSRKFAPRWSSWPGKEIPPFVPVVIGSRPFDGWKGLVILVLCGGTVVVANNQDGTTAPRIPILTVCDALRESARYQGQVVIIVGRSVGTSEGSWLDEDCALKLNIEGRSYPAAISTAFVASWFAPPPQMPPSFKWDKAALRQALDRVKTTTRLESKEHWCAVYGRLETAPTHEVELGGGRVVTVVGYGHLNAAPAQLVSPSDGFLRFKGK